MSIVKLTLIILLPIMLNGYTLNDIILKNYSWNHFQTFNNYAMQKSDDNMPVLMHKIGNKISRLYFEQYQINTEKEKHIFVYHSGRYKNIKILIELDNKDTEVNIWLPQLRKTRRFYTFKKTDSWNGSNFTYGDILLIHPNDENHEIIGIETINTNLAVLKKFKIKDHWESKNKSIIKIKSTPKRDILNYDYRISYIDIEYFFDYNVTYFKNNIPIKLVEKAWYEKKGGVSLLGYWYAKNLISNTESLIYIPKSSSFYNVNLSKDFFSKHKLNKHIHIENK